MPEVNFHNHITPNSHERERDIDMRTKRTFENWVKAVVNESKHYPLLKKLKGEFNQEYLRAYFDLGYSARQFCNSITEIT